MDKIKNLHIPVNKFELNTEYNTDDFLFVKIQAMSVGYNLNDSNFNMESFEKSKNTFAGKPLLCAFPKDKYGDTYKMGDGHNSSELMYDAEYDEFYYSYLDPNSERCVGYIPIDSNITLEEVDGVTWIVMEAVIFKKYNFELVKDILEKKTGRGRRNNKRISVELEVVDSEIKFSTEKQKEVEYIYDFNGIGVTILFDDTQEAMVGANLKAFASSDKYKSFVSKSFSSILDKPKEENVLEVNSDMTEIVIETYPSRLRYDNDGNVFKDFQGYSLTNHQMYELFKIAINKMNNEDSCHWRYCIRDYDDTYVYIEDYDDDLCGQIFRFEYSINQEESKIDINLESREKVISNGYKIVMESEVDDLADIKDKDVFIDDNQNPNPDDIDTKEDFVDVDPDNDGDADDTDDPEEDGEDDAEEEIEDDDEDMARKCSENGATYICNTSNHLIFEIDGEIYASAKNSENLEERFAIKAMFGSIVQEDVGGVLNPEGVEALPTLKVDFSEKLKSIFVKFAELDNKCKEYEVKIETLNENLSKYQNKDILAKFEEISEGVNITDAEKVEWKEKIENKSFSSEGDLIEKFGGFIFKKSIEQKQQNFQTNVETVVDVKINSYDDIINSYKNK